MAYRCPDCNEKPDFDGCACARQSRAIEQLRELEEEGKRLCAENKIMREALEKIYPGLPSYMGESDDGTCARTIVDKALAAIKGPRQ